MAYWQVSVTARATAASSETSPLRRASNSRAPRIFAAGNPGSIVSIAAISSSAPWPARFVAAESPLRQLSNHKKRDRAFLRSLSINAVRVAPRQAAMYSEKYSFPGHNTSGAGRIARVRGGTRTRTPDGTKSAAWRVYQFRHANRCNRGSDRNTGAATPRALTDWHTMRACGRSGIIASSPETSCECLTERCS